MNGAQEWVIENLLGDERLFNLVAVMRAIGEKLHHHCMVRFDPAREQYRFTVVLDWALGRCDTDDPLETLCEMIYTIYGKGGKQDEKDHN